MELTPLTAISAIDGRYRKHVQHLDEYFSEYALMKYRINVEIDYLLFLEKKKFFKFTNKASRYLQKLKEDFGPEDAQEIKQIERGNTKVWVHKDSERESLLSLAIGKAIDAALNDQGTES